MNKDMRVDNKLPYSEKEQHILYQRTEQLSKASVEEIKYQDNNTYVRFTLGQNEFYGIPYQHIKEIMSGTSLTMLPGVSRHIAGIINYRGALLTVIDLKNFFDFEDKTYSEKPYVIVIKAYSFVIGVLIDTINDSVMYNAATLDAPLACAGAIKPEYIIGLHNGVTAILNMESILTDIAKETDLNKVGA